MSPLLCVNCYRADSPETWVKVMPCGCALCVECGQTHPRHPGEEVRR